MDTICFVANGYKTLTFKAIADQLASHNVKVCWIVPTRLQYDELLKEYEESTVLLIDRSLINDSCQSVGDFKLCEIVYGDLRVWRHSVKEGLKYLTSIQQPIVNFIKSNEIHLIFGEDTWAHELLIHRMCNQLSELRCGYYSSMSARIPNGKILFCDDEKHAEYVPVCNNNAKYLLNTIKIEKPFYFAVNDKLLKKSMSLKGNLGRLKRFISNENIHPTDPMVETNRWMRFKIVTREIINQKMYTLLTREELKVLEDKKYVLFGFHKQPEASIDVCGRYFENQYENVLNIWRQLPEDWYLAIKEHSNAIGDRSYNFFKRLQKYPRIILINEHADSLQLIKKCQLVVTNTGTMALEAALQGVPSITLSKVVFNNLNYCRHCTWQDFEKYRSLVDLVNEIKSLPNNVDSYTNLVNEYAFDGYLTNIITMPNVLNDKNILDLSNAFLALISFNNKKLNL